MSLFVKLCGLRTPQDVETAIDAGANAVGFVMTESPRRVSVAEAAHLR
ncbi:MAG: phosphoribosylanthranilate isomerase, partial [Dehalococcoidia bacterium]